MRILVTGAHGLLGRCLLRSAGSDEEIVGCGRSAEPVGAGRYVQVDIMDKQAICDLVGALKSDWVIHTAALTNVDQCETDRELARRLNVDAVANVAAACATVDAGLTHLSTDYVFDGESGPYAEGDPPNPLSFYGALKLESEEHVLNAGKGLVIRTLWLYGYAAGVRNNLVTWPLQAIGREKANIQVVDDQWGNATYADDLAERLLILCRAGRTGLLHMGGSDFMTRLELTRRLFELFDLPAELIEPTTTEALSQPAPRPLRSGLRTDAVTAATGKAPVSLAEGLRRMQEDEEFRRDFSFLF